MADGQGDAPQPDPQAAARDWITIWQSELSALAGDREVHEAWTRWVALWAQAAELATRFLPTAAPAAGEHAGGSARPSAAAGPQAIVAAPDARDAAIRSLGERVAELERRLSERDGAAGSSVKPKPDSA